MNKKSGLGRGLSNLIPDFQEAPRGGSAEYQEISIEDISPNPDQPRKSFPPDQLKELAQTLKSIGLIEPIVVRPWNGKYQIISGERRYRAAKLAGFKRIPAVLKSLDDNAALEMAIVENIQREELNAIEEGRSYEIWMQRTGLKAADLAERVGKDRTTITNLVRLLKLPPEILQLVEQGKLTAGQARPLLAIGERKKQSNIAEKAVKESWSARRVEEEVARLEHPTSGSTGATSKVDPNIRKLEDRIRAKLTAKVQIQHKRGGGGKIMLHYAHLDDLDRILEILKLR